MAKAMCYHAEYFNHPDSDQAEGGYHAMGKVRDVFDGEWYQSMLHTPMVLKGEQTGATFFEGKHNVALGLSTDGFFPFKKRKLTTWPIILFNYKLLKSTFTLIISYV